MADIAFEFEIAAAVVFYLVWGWIFASARRGQRAVEAGMADTLPCERPLG